MRDRSPKVNTRQPEKRWKRHGSARRDHPPSPFDALQRLHLRRGHPNAPRTSWRTQYRRWPHDAALLTDLAQTRRRRGNVEAARTDVATVLDRHPDHARGLRLLGSIHQHLQALEARRPPNAVD